MSIFDYFVFFFSRHVPIYLLFHTLLQGGAGLWGFRVNFEAIRAKALFWIRGFSGSERWGLLFSFFSIST